MSITVANHDANVAVRTITERSEHATRGKDGLSSFARLLDSSVQQFTNATVDSGTEHHFSQQEPSALRPASPDAVLSGAAGFSPLDHGETTYSTKVRIGDAAVGFAVRPVVGPAALRDQSAHFSMASETAAPGFDITSVEWALADNPIRYAAEWGRQHSVPMMTTNSLRPSSQALPTIPFDLRMNELPLASKGGNPTFVSAQSLPGPRILQVPGRHGGEHLANQPPPQSRATLYASTAPFVQLLANPAEYRLLIRAQNLDASERAYIAREITSTLSHFGLANLPVRTVHPVRGAKNAGS